MRMVEIEGPPNLHHAGFSQIRLTTEARALLPHVFNLAPTKTYAKAVSGIFSVALFPPRLFTSQAYSITDVKKTVQRLRKCNSHKVPGLSSLVKRARQSKKA